jgi:hypothetical protein
MNCNPTLTAQEFQTIHNSLYRLQNIIGRLEDVLKPDLYAQLTQATNDIRSGLAGAYEQDNAAYHTKHDHYYQVRRELGLQATWSVYEVGNLSDPHPFAGTVRVVYQDHWGDRPVSCNINGSSWAALYVAANACIRDSGDTHHVFIEGFRPDPQDPRTLILITGS